MFWRLFGNVRWSMKHWRIYFTCSTYFTYCSYLTHCTYFTYIFPTFFPEKFQSHTLTSFIIRIIIKAGWLRRRWCSIPTICLSGLCVHWVIESSLKCCLMSKYIKWISTKVDTQLFCLITQPTHVYNLCYLECLDCQIWLRFLILSTVFSFYRIGRWPASCFLLYWPGTCLGATCW